MFTSAKSATPVARLIITGAIGLFSIMPAIDVFVSIKLLSTLKQFRYDSNKSILRQLFCFIPLAVVTWRHSRFAPFSSTPVKTHKTSKIQPATPNNPTLSPIFPPIPPRTFRNLPYDSQLRQPLLLAPPRLRRTQCEASRELRE